MNSGRVWGWVGMGEGNYQCGDGNIKFELFLQCLNEDVK